jgi:DNA repair protein RadC
MASVKPIVTARDVYVRLRAMRRARQEHFMVFYLNSRAGLIRRELISIGILDATIAHPREVFYPAIVHNASNVIIAHNHPSGDTAPSEADVRMTERLVQAGALLGIEVLDHVIVGESSYTSLRSEGLIQ